MQSKWEKGKVVSISLALSRERNSGLGEYKPKPLEVVSSQWRWDNPYPNHMTFFGLSPGWPIYFWETSPKQRRGPWKDTEHWSTGKGCPPSYAKKLVFWFIYQLASLWKRRRLWVCWEHPSVTEPWNESNQTLEGCDSLRCCLREALPSSLNHTPMRTPRK